jgi:hypothetical protein
MARDFSIRRDLQDIGLPERTIRVLEKVQLLIDALEQIDANAGAITDIETATVALEELLEDAAITLETLDERLDEQENGNGPYVKKTGDTMSGALNVNDLLECDTFKINVSPTAETVVCTHTITISVGATAYKIPIVAA